MSKAFAPTPAELALVNQIFANVDGARVGLLSGDVLVPVFEGSHLPTTTLGEIWQLADSDNAGVLTRKGVAVAVRLIGHAQKGEQPSEALINKRMYLRAYRLRHPAVF
jgi:epidermal growth factor receptor substrate 15